MLRWTASMQDQQVAMNAAGLVATCPNTWPELSSELTCNRQHTCSLHTPGDSPPPPVHLCAAAALAACLVCEAVGSDVVLYEGQHHLLVCDDRLRPQPHSAGVRWCMDRQMW